MDKANGGRPLHPPVRNRRAPAPGWDGWRGCPPRACACTGDRRRRNPASTPRRSFWAAAASAGWRISRPAAARPPLSFSSFTVGEAPCGEAVELRLRQRLRRCQPFDNLPLLSAQLRLDCLSAQSFGGFPPAPPRLSMEPAGRRAVVGMQAIPLSEKGVWCPLPALYPPGRSDHKRADL